VDVHAVGVPIGGSTGLGLLSNHIAQALGLAAAGCVVVGLDVDVYSTAGIGLAQHLELPLPPLGPRGSAPEDRTGSAAIVGNAGARRTGLVQKSKELDCKEESSSDQVSERTVQGAPFSQTMHIWW